ncbi:MAG TPA: hypothetical protein P5244_02320 [Syntrophales bacterium]|nr:hypothetical protein [Syntrophales bacterium]HRT88294.1 hypothetical protein [Anaerohalosphaeraceae bacterium]
MNSEKMMSLGARIFFSLSFICLFIAVFERLANLAGYSILYPYYYPWRLLEFAAIFLLFTIAIVLRQIREELKQQKKA